MKSPLYSVFIVASVLVAIAHCFPGLSLTSDSSEENDRDVADVLLGLPGGGAFSFPRPFVREPDFEEDLFNGFVERIQDQINRMTESLRNALSFSPWGQIPDGANKTSTTQIIDGHIVTVNDTVYSSGDEDNTAVFRVRVVEVKPLNQTENSDNTTEVDIGGGEEVETVTTGSTQSTDKQGDKEETTTQARSVETVEDLTGNEIPKNPVDALTA